MFINTINTDNPEATMDASGYQPPPRRNAEDLLDDVFGDSQSAHGEDPTLNAADSLPSDVPRLEREHTTAGYRDGITAAKAQSIQGGFDEGFSLGASVGSRVGQVLGLLDGIAESVKDTGAGVGTGAGAGDHGSASALVVSLARQAREELTVEKVFGQEYWFNDGTWRYRISRDGAAEPENIVFEDVADAHPLIVKWTAIVDEQVKRWNIDMNVLATSTETAPASEAKEPVVQAKPTVEPKNALLDW